MDLTLIDPELRGATRRMPPLPLGSALGRRAIQALGGLLPAGRRAGVALDIRGDTTPPLRIYRPTVRHDDAALLWIHGGGLVIGGAAQDDRFCLATALGLGLVVVSVEYRLAPEAPFPLPLDDCHAAWRWLQREAGSLGVDPARMAIGGQSAGGGLAASLAQRLHDEGGAQPVAQWLFCPMLDDRTAARRELDVVAHPIWDNRLNRIGWGAYLAGEPGDDPPPYAAAARRSDLRGLPPAWIGVGDIELFYAEDRAYAARLRAAGVDTTLDVVPGAPHGFESWAADTRLAREYIARARGWLGRSLDATAP